jgi:hypothetical protein
VNHGDYENSPSACVGRLASGPCPEKETIAETVSSTFEYKELSMGASPRKRKTAARSNEPRRTKIVLRLSQETKANLEKLRLKSLDRQGRKPAASQIIEGLINAAAKSEPEAPYPNNKSS